MTLKFLDEYSGQTTQQLLEMASEYRVDSLVLALEQGLESKAPPRTIAERTILAVEALEREVNNGGYDQFFLNSSNEYAPEVVAALTRIDCPKTARITQEALDALAIAGPLTVAAIEEAAEVEDSAREEALHRLDDRYYESGEALADKLFAYVRTHASEVRLP